MKKLTLDFDALVVDSFQVAAEVRVDLATCRCTECNCTYTCP
ncbi:MAG TPA: hypothetical protein VFJ16_09345 [Longimicrobium sp.]|nr:hypothetical protein [Longimicrobium sp.]